MSNYIGQVLPGFSQIPRGPLEQCKNPCSDEPTRDIDACLGILQAEVATLDSALTELFGRLSPVVTDKINPCENAPGFVGSTILGSNLATIANRVASMRRAVNSYTDNLGV